MTQMFFFVAFLSILLPQAFYPDPFRGGNHILVICDTYTPAGEPLPTNTRHDCAKQMEAAKESIPWFGIEQVIFTFQFYISHYRIIT